MRAYTLHVVVFCIALSLRGRTTRRALFKSSAHLVRVGMRVILNGLLCKTGFTHDQHNNVVVIVYTAYIARVSVDAGGGTVRDDVGCVCCRAR